MFTSSCKKEETSKKDPVISWSNPADISFGTLLSATQLNATADVPGTFVYTPPMGTKLNEGLNQDLKVAFTPTDAVTYNTLNKTVKINVNKPFIPVNLPMVNIPAGTFTMGSPTSEVGRTSDEVEHQVTLSVFRMSKYEITNTQYAAFLNAKSIGNNGLYAAGAFPDQGLIYASSGSNDWGLHYTAGQWISAANYENHPVTEVTWYGATEYATYAGGRLPTEAEWEYACRGNTTTPFNTGNCLSDAQANYDWAFLYSTCTNTITTYPGTAQAVGTYAANAYGLHDMHGNVAEWCSDRYDAYPTTPQTNPTGAASGSNRVIRGGGWYDSPRYCRSARRIYRSPSTYNSGLGFRVVLAP